MAAYLLSYQAEPAAAQRKGVRRSYTDVQAATVLGKRGSALNIKLLLGMTGFFWTGKVPLSRSTIELDLGLERRREKGEGRRSRNLQMNTIS